MRADRRRPFVAGDGARGEPRGGERRDQQNEKEACLHARSVVQRTPIGSRPNAAESIRAYRGELLMARAQPRASW